MSKRDEKNEIRKHMEILGLTYAEAKQLYQEDNSDEVCAEVAEMEKKAKTMKRRYENDVTKKRAPAKKEKPLDMEKREIISVLNYCLMYPDEVVDDTFLKIEHVWVKNDEREILFDVGENEYSVTLTKHRKKKG